MSEQAPKPDGGPAFPCGRYKEYGMTLRDYFAGQALASMRAEFVTDRTAQLAYEYADAMLAEREKP